MIPWPDSPRIAIAIAAVQWQPPNCYYYYYYPCRGRKAETPWRQQQMHCREASSGPCCASLDGMLALKQQEVHRMRQEAFHQMRRLGFCCSIRTLQMLVELLAVLQCCHGCDQEKCNFLPGAAMPVYSRRFRPPFCTERSLPWPVLQSGRDLPEVIPSIGPRSPSPCSENQGAKPCVALL